jgi:hypothetical protein
LSFAVRRAEALRHAAVPTLSFALGIEAPAEARIASVLLDVQIQIAARLRGYGAGAQEQLLELFGTADRWATTLRTLPWVRATVVVPAFAGQTEVEIPVACSYDLEVTAGRYFAALSEGEIPLEFLFSGSVFFAAANGALRAARIPLDTEVEFRLPVTEWREAVDRHFPGAGWLRLGRESLERLSAYKARGAYQSWDAAIDALLETQEVR